MTTAAPLETAFEHLSLDGAIFFRAEFTERWSYESPPAQIAQLLRPGAERLIMFHIVARGSCWISLGDGERHWAKKGDIIVLPYGDQHRAGGVESAECVPIASLLDPLPWSTVPVLRYGSGGERTDIICGYLHSAHPLFDSRLAILPALFVVEPPAGPARRWLDASIEYALEVTADGGAGKPSATRLPELLLIETLRLHLASAPGDERGWLAALRDPVLSAALAQLHAAPDRKWTVSDLAATVVVSRSALDERFRDVLGRSPIRYLTDWRLHIASTLLDRTDLTVAEIARRVGYDAEEAFSRAFKRRYGEAPRSWRSSHEREGRPASR